MIRLTLPPYDASRPMTIQARCSAQSWGYEMNFSPPLVFRTHPDGFVGDVSIPFNSIGLPASPEWALQFFHADVTFIPDDYGMHGGEGWFALEPGVGTWVFVHDLQVYYTPLEQQDSGRAGAFFS